MPQPVKSPRGVKTVRCRHVLLDYEEVICQTSSVKYAAFEAIWASAVGEAGAIDKTVFANPTQGRSSTPIILPTSGEVAKEARRAHDSAYNCAVLAYFQNKEAFSDSDRYGYVYVYDDVLGIVLIDEQQGGGPDHEPFRAFDTEVGHDASLAAEADPFFIADGLFVAHLCPDDAEPPSGSRKEGLTDTELTDFRNPVRLPQGYLVYWATAQERSDAAGLVAKVTCADEESAFFAFFCNYQARSLPPYLQDHISRAKIRLAQKHLAGRRANLRSEIRLAEKELTNAMRTRANPEDVDKTRMALMSAEDHAIQATLVSSYLMEMAQSLRIHKDYLEEQTGKAPLPGLPAGDDGYDYVSVARRQADHTLAAIDSELRYAEAARFRNAALPEMIRTALQQHAEAAQAAAAAQQKLATDKQTLETEKGNDLQRLSNILIASIGTTLTLLQIQKFFDGHGGTTLFYLLAFSIPALLFCLTPWRGGRWHWKALSIGIFVALLIRWILALSGVPLGPLQVAALVILPVACALLAKLFLSPKPAAVKGGYTHRAVEGTTDSKNTPATPPKAHHNGVNTAVATEDEKNQKLPVRR